MKMDAEEKVLRKLGLHYQMPDSGCCGMAGAFGFERRFFLESNEIPAVIDRRYSARILNLMG